MDDYTTITLETSIGFKYRIKRPRVMFITNLPMPEYKRLYCYPVRTVPKDRSSAFANIMKRPG